jgi:hypothetical protein
MVFVVVVTDVGKWTTTNESILPLLNGSKYTAFGVTRIPAPESNYGNKMDQT